MEKQGRQGAKSMALFGAHLVRRGVATASQIVEALARQNARRVPIDQLAITRGALTAADVLRVMDEARRTHDDFVRCSVKLGLLAPAAVADLLDAQRATGPRIGELLVEMGVLTHVTLLRELEEFQKAPAASGVHAVNVSIAIDHASTTTKRG